MDELPVIIAGAGPGGLTLAIALQRAGVAVRLLERAPTVRASGAGLTLQINAMRMLATLELAAPIIAEGEVLQALRVETAEGAVLSDVPLADAARQFGVPGVMIHRGALTRLLLARLDPDVIRCNAQVVGVEPRNGAVVAELADGSAVRGRALVGADGIHSAVRTAVFGETSLRYAGYTCWRGIANLPRPLGNGVTSERWGRGRRFGIVPIDAERTYWYGTQNASHGKADAAATRAELHERFSRFAEPVAALLDATPSDAILHNDIIDLPPLQAWCKGRVALMGDAAHAMTPNMGQGACQAIEDAIVLSHAIVHGDDVEAALAEYQTRRMPRAHAVAQRSWSIGRAAQWENVLARGLRDTLTRMLPNSVMLRNFAKVWEVAVP